MNVAGVDSIAKKCVVCLKWGDKYPSYYVNRLHKMIARNTTGEVEFFCITENSFGIDDAVNIIPLPDFGLKGWWYKLTLFSSDIFNFECKSILYIDLDVIVVDNIDCFFDYVPDDFVIGHDLQTKKFNSSVFRLSLGSQSQVWDEFVDNKDFIISDLHGDQDWISQTAAQPVTWPDAWVVSYKKQCCARVERSWGFIGKLLRKLNILTILGDAKIPDGAKIIQFHGKPDPEDVMDKPYGLYRSASWIRHHWCHDDTTAN